MSLREKWSSRDWLVLLGLLALAVLAWYRVLFYRQWSFGIEVDFLRQFYPARVFAANSLAAGHFPLWTPYVFCGSPFFASYQTAMLYPFNLLMVGLYGAAGGGFSLKAQCAFVVFHLYMAGVFTYILAREIKVGRAGAAVAAITFMFSGYMVAQAGHLNQVSAASWIPLIFFFFYRCLDRRKISYALGAGAALGVALLAGHFQPLFYLCCMLLLYVAYNAVQRWRGDDSKPGLAYGLGSLGLTLLVGVALAAAQLIPTYQLIGVSSRRNIPYELAATYSLPRRQLITLIFPHFFGSSPSSYVGALPPAIWEVYGYSGLVGGALGVIALLRRKKGLVIFFWLVLLLSVILALGPGGYVFTALFKLHLLFNRFKDPARMLVLFGFASAMLAGLGADHLFKVFSSDDERSGTRTVVFLLTALLALTLVFALAVSVYLAVRGPGRYISNGARIRSMVLPVLLLAVFLYFLILARRFKRLRTLLPACVVVIVLVDLLALNVPWNVAKINPDDIFGDARASRYIAGLEGPFRVETDAATMYKSLDDGPIYGIEKASGDDSLVLEEYYRYRELVTPSVSPGVQPGLFKGKGVRSPLLDLMNDKYFISRERIDPALTTLKFKYVGNVGGVYIYRNRAVTQRAWMSDAVVMKSNEMVFRELEKSGGKGLAKEALVVGGKGAGLKEGEAVKAVTGKVGLMKSGPNSVVFETAPDCRGLLVTSEMFYPGWEVYVDGKKKDVVRTNYLYRGVILPGGQKKVEFRFHPTSMYAGVVISLVTLGLLLAYLVWLLVRRRTELKKRGGEAR